MTIATDLTEEQVQQVFFCADKQAHWSQGSPGLADQYRQEAIVSLQRAIELEGGV